MLFDIDIILDNKTNLNKGKKIVDKLNNLKIITKPR